MLSHLNFLVSDIDERIEKENFRNLIMYLKCLNTTASSKSLFC